MTLDSARRWGLALVLLGLTACSSSESASSTVASTASPVSVAPPTTASVPTTVATTIAPPTTASFTTTAAPTTAAPTTAAPTTTVGPSEAAKAELADTLDAFNADFDQCFRDSNACDVAALLDTYVAPDEDVIRTFMTDTWEAYEADGTVNVSEGRIKRSVPLVEASDDGTSGATHMCEESTTFDVPRPEATVAPTTDPGYPPIYAQFYFVWAKQADGRWLIVHSEWGFGADPNVMAEGGIPSLSDEELAKCFK